MVERFVMRLVDHRKESTGEEWTELHETPHPKGEWVRFSEVEPLVTVLQRLKPNCSADWQALIDRVLKPFEDPQ